MCSLKNHELYKLFKNKMSENELKIIRSPLNNKKIIDPNPFGDINKNNIKYFSGMIIKIINRIYS